MKKLGLYIHIPFCKRKCAYCDFVSYPNMEHLYARYADAVVAEARMYKEYLGDRTVDTVFIGGGTPPLLQPELIRRIIGGVKAVCGWQPEEVTIEANPESLTESAVKAYADIGFNRMSLGLQTHEDAVLSRIGRRHDYHTFLKAYEAAQKHIGNVNVDVIFGLPGQTMESFHETLIRLIALAPQHISAYALKLEENTPLAQQYNGADDETDRQLYHMAVKLLTDAGYNHYETSNFAKAGYVCKHNLKYWTGQEYIGLGVAAHSYMANGQPVRFSNTEYIEEYLMKAGNGQSPAAKTETLSDEDIIKEYIMLRLRLAHGIDTNDYQSRFGGCFFDDYQHAIKWAQNNGLITTHDAHIRPTLKGFDLQNTLICEFMKKL